MNLINIRPFEACRFNPGTHGFSGKCSFCGKVFSGRERDAEFMGNSRAGNLFSLCSHHGRQAKFDEIKSCTAQGLDRTECRLGGACACKATQ